jgi:hypothetical protein
MFTVLKDLSLQLPVTGNKYEFLMDDFNHIQRHSALLVFKILLPTKFI